MKSNVFINNLITKVYFQIRPLSVIYEKLSNQKTINFSGKAIVNKVNGHQL